MPLPENPFEELPRVPASHFKLYFFAAVLHVLEQVGQSFETWEEAFEHFPFLEGYYSEIQEWSGEELTLREKKESWQAALTSWEESATQHLPLLALRERGELSYIDLTLLISIGLIEEDARFGLLFEAMQGLAGQHRPTLGLLNGWWREVSGPTEIRARLRHLQMSGLVQIVNPEVSRLEWALQVPGLLWDVLRGEVRKELAAWLRYYPPEHLTEFDRLIMPEELQPTLPKLPSLLASGEVQAVIVRGPHHNGRLTLLGALARELGLGLLEVSEPAKEETRSLLGPLATMLRALPGLRFDLEPGETVEVPLLPGYNGPVGIALGRSGGVSGPGAAQAFTVNLPLPEVAERCQHWSQVLNVSQEQSIAGELPQISERFRLTSGNIRRVGRLAQAYAKLAGREAITLEEVQQACRNLNRQALETLAAHLPCEGDWSRLALSADTLRELTELESRCRHRERLLEAVGAGLGRQLTPGVRALLQGPSGTGKTLAARLLAAVLQKDLYRLDLSAVVNKYIGETEKSLNQVFARAEELDVILLLDEGDALLTRRTNVQTSNDRYANLETNFLLQRLENYEGILLVTTNAGDRIDSAFQRRMDVVVEFYPPEAAERRVIWQLHLPENHAIDYSLLEEVTRRCHLTGGQIRNAALHAALLALNAGSVITGAHLEMAVRREYRKAGMVCPLRNVTLAELN